MQIDKLHTFVNEWNFVYGWPQNDIKTKDMLNKIPSQKSIIIWFFSSFTKLLASHSKLRKTEVGK